MYLGESMTKVTPTQADVERAHADQLLLIRWSCQLHGVAAEVRVILCSFSSSIHFMVVPPSLPSLILCNFPAQHRRLTVSRNLQCFGTWGCPPSNANEA